LLATTGDYLRLWSVADDGLGRGTLLPKKEALLNNVSLEFGFGVFMFVIFVLSL